MDATTGIRERYLAAIAEASDEAALEAVRVAALGKKGEVSGLMRGLGAMAPEERQVAGPALNALKDELTEALAEAKARLADAALEARVAARVGRRDAAGPAGGAGDDPSGQPGDWTRSSRSSPTSGSASPRGRRSRATGTTSTR